MLYLKYKMVVNSNKMKSLLSRYKKKINVKILKVSFDFFSSCCVINRFVSVSKHSQWEITPHLSPSQNVL